MADASYKDWPFIFSSRGIVARKVDDTASPTEYLNMDNVEELFENALSQRLGTTILNGSGLGQAASALDGTVNTLAKLGGLNGASWRYAGTSTGKLYRRSGLSAGAYTLISSSVSGNPMWAVPFRPDVSSYPYIFFADANGMFKDNGGFSAPKQSGIFQPQFPIIAQVLIPDLVQLDPYTDAAGSYNYSGIAGGTNTTYASTNLTSRVLITGLQPVMVSDPTQIQLFQLLSIDTAGQQETVLVVELTETGFWANFTKNHLVGASVTGVSLSVTVPASTTATVSKSFGGNPIAAWPIALEQSDYIGIMLYLSDPSQLQSITIKFDCGDGTFNTDYFYKVVAQGPMQSLLETINDPTTAATDVLLSQSLGLYSNTSSGIAELNSGLMVWTPLLMQLSDFAGSGRADFNDPVFNWANVNGYQIQIVTNDQSSVTVQMASLILMGGAGPDTLGGVAYDYRFTFYNADDGTESNPSMAMTNVNPPNDTNWVYPRRQPVRLTMKWKTPADSQVTHLRIYRRGGTLGDNWRRVDEIVRTGIGGQSYTDTTPDASLGSADILSLTNDVPVTSTLPVPVNTTFQLSVQGSSQSDQPVTPVSMANISIGQQVLLGSPTARANNFEIVIVLSVTSTNFNALVQNDHSAGEAIQATAKYGQPCTGMAFDKTSNIMYYWGDPNNPHFVYYSEGNNPQAVGSASYIEVGVPSEPVTVVVPMRGNVYVSTTTLWYALAPGANGKPTPYPTAAKHACIAPFGWVFTDHGVPYQSVDGIRFFSGGASEYMTQDVEFIFQGVGTTPIVEADQTQLSKTVMSYWNNMVFVSYVGVDGKRHRLIIHMVYKRWRNDDIDAQSLLLEEDTNTILFGDSLGLIHLDRQIVPTDQAVSGGIIVASPITIDLQTVASNQGIPDLQKNYNELTMDVNTQGQTLSISLIFDDGNSTVFVGTVSNTQRGKVNLILNGGKGYQFYKVALRITGSVSAFVNIYQCSIKAIPIAKTRLSFDTYKLDFGMDESKFCKQVYIDYDSTQPVTVNVYYDDEATPSFPAFTLPATGGFRNTLRQRLHAKSFRLIRFVGTSTADFRVWDFKADWKPQTSGKGYQSAEVAMN
jgi:hypothetical protein